MNQSNSNTQGPLPPVHPQSEITNPLCVILLFTSTPSINSPPIILEHALISFRLYSNNGVLPILEREAMLQFSLFPALLRNPC